jgi:5-methylcytosine-specific restriction enzyme subunit McrC
VTGSTIPIENVYYLFCYAWNRFEQAQSIELGAEPSPDLPNLLARVLLNGTRAILRRGLDRDYRERGEEIATIRGRIDLGATVQLRGRCIRRVHCQFDELSHDLLHNQIIKASLKRLARAPMIDPVLASDLRSVAARMGDVADIWLEPAAFGRVRLHRNNAYYDLLLKVAQLAFECLLPRPDGHGFRFEDVTRDEKKMARVFEEFVRNFYRREQRAFAVEPLTISWDAEPLSLSGAGRLPSMRVDVYLRSSSRRIIIDTKYYANVLQSHHEVESYHSGNLYQLFSYLRNAAGKDPAFTTAEGVLLYPWSGKALRDRYRLQGHEVTLATLDLSQAWPNIASQLHELIGGTGTLSQAVAA